MVQTNSPRCPEPPQKLPGVRDQELDPLPRAKQPHLEAVYPVPQLPRGIGRRDARDHSHFDEGIHEVTPGERWPRTELAEELEQIEHLAIQPGEQLFVDAVLPQYSEDRFQFGLGVRGVNDL